MKIIIIFLILFTSCMASRNIVYDNPKADTIYVDKVMMASRHLTAVPVKVNYIIHKGNKYFINGREVSYWQYIPTGRKQFQPHSKPNGND